MPLQYVKKLASVVVIAVNISRFITGSADVWCGFMESHFSELKLHVAANLCLPFKMKEHPSMLA